MKPDLLDLGLLCADEGAAHRDNGHRWASLDRDQRLRLHSHAVACAFVWRPVRAYKQHLASLSCILPVASALRISLIELSTLRRSHEGLTTKSQQIYTYLTGPRFKHRVECIAEKFTELRKDLDGERKWMNKQWAKRDRELTIVLEATSGMYGDLQGIAGRSLQEIDALEGPMLLELDQ